MKVRYKLHWNSNSDPEKKWVIYDWSIKSSIVFIENRAIGRQVCNLLNSTSKAGSTKSEAKSEAARINGKLGGRPRKRVK